MERRLAAARCKRPASKRDEGRLGRDGWRVSGAERTGGLNEILARESRN